MTKNSLCNKKMEGCKPNILLTLLLLYFHFQNEVASGCESPIPQCDCSPLTEDPTKLAILCRNKKLHSVPNITASDTVYYEISFTNIGSSNSNVITELHANAFAGLKVSRIDLSTNYLTNVDPAAFSGLETRLESLTIDGNSSFAPPFSALTNLNALQTLDVEYFKLNIIDDSSLPPLGNLRNLKLKAMSIQTIYSNAFLNKYPLLEKLEIIDNSNLNSGQIPTGPLRRLPSLKHLSLINNGITSVEYRAFEVLNELEILDLSQNRIAAIKPNALDGLYNKLQSLILLDNQLHSSDLTGLNNSWIHLHQLNLALNPLSVFPQDTFSRMPNLAYLNLHETQLPSISAVNLKGLPSLHHLDITYNPINSIEDGAFLHTPNLSLLQMGHLHYNFDTQMASKTLSLTARTFEGLENSLTELNLEKTSLTGDTYMWSAFSNLRRLKRLELISVGLHSIPDCVFYNNKNLQVIYLAQNNISSINQATFSGLENSIEQINLQENSIVNIDECLVQSLTHLYIFAFDKNPLHCDCQMKWYKDKIINENKQYNWTMRCVTPSYLKDLTVQNIPEANLVCSSSSIPVTCNSNVCVPDTTTIAPTTVTIPSIDISNVVFASTINSITISFASYNTNNIKWFTVTYQKTSATDVSNPVIVSKQTLQHTFKNLESDQNYEICIKATLTDDQETSKRCVSYKTKLTTNADETSGGDNSTTNTVVGAVVGCIVAAIIIGIIIYLIIHHKKPKQKNLPPVVFTNLSPDQMPRESDNARRWVKTKPQSNGANGGACNDIQVSVISGKMQPDDQRVSAGSYQSLKGNTDFSAVPQRSSNTSVPAVNVKDFRPNSGQHSSKYANMMQKSAGPHYINDPKNQPAVSMGYYSNDVGKRALPTTPKDKSPGGVQGKPLDPITGYSNKGYKHDSTPAKKTEYVPNAYDEIEL